MQQLFIKFLKAGEKHYRDLGPKPVFQVQRALDLDSGLKAFALQSQ